MTSAKSVRKIKQFWRAYKHLDTSSLVKAFHEQGPTVERVKPMRYSFVIAWLCVVVA